MKAITIRGIDEETDSRLRKMAEESGDSINTTIVYSAFKSNDNDVLHQLQTCEEIYVNIVVLAELIAGFKARSREAQNRAELKSFLNSPRIVLDHLTDATAEFYANIYLSLHTKGTPIPTNDMWIAASAMQHGCALYSLDRHFLLVDGLLLI
jgi:tRNA(fMet)-specific endonuclease VapC